MIGSAQVVRGDEGLRMFFDGIMASIKRLESIINSILDVSRIDVAALDVRTAPVSIVVLVKEIEADFRRALDDRHLDFRTQGLSELPFISADSDLLYKAFYHLIVNAIKYTPDGGKITVSGRVVQSEEEQDVVEVVIADTGVGIDQEHHELIFDKFYQTGQVMLHSSGVTKFKGGGPGLGLAIARGAILAHKGEIWVESEGYDENLLPGSSFYVRLPLAEWQEGREAEHS
jgi:signal transduction histidine kinase